MAYTKAETRTLGALRAYIAEHGRCELAYDEIAKLAVVGKSTAMNLVLKAEGAGDLVVRRRAGDPHVLLLPAKDKLSAA